MNELAEYGEDIKCIVYLGNVETWIDLAKNKKESSQLYKKMARANLEKAKELFKTIPGDNLPVIVKEHIENLEAQLV